MRTMGDQRAVCLECSGLLSERGWGMESANTGSIMNTVMLGEDMPVSWAAKPAGCLDDSDQL